MNATVRRIRHGLILLLSVLLLSVAVALPAGAQGIRRVAPEKLAGYWIVLNTKIDVDVPNSGRNLDKPGCVAVAYTVGADGVPRNVKAVKTVPASDLGPTAVSAVSHFRYGPALSNRNDEAVATYYIVPFNSPDDATQQQRLIDACRLPGYDQG